MSQRKNEVFKLISSRFRIELVSLVTMSPFTMSPDMKGTMAPKMLATKLDRVTRLPA